MADIRRFRPLMYAPKHSDAVKDLIAPPYDVLSEEQRELTAARHERNIVRLTLPVSDNGDRYTHAAETLAAWRSAEDLVQVSSSSLFSYSQEFTNATGERLKREGFLCLLDLVPFGPDGVLPHERTLAKHRADRLRLRTTTSADLEPIFGMYEPAESGRQSIASLRRTELVRVVDDEGVEHVIARIAEPDAESIVEELVGRPVYIVDGHHRYTTALEQAAAAGLSPGDPGASILIFLCPMTDPGLVIGPTHRVIRNAEDALLGDALRQRLAEWYDLEGYSTPEAGYAALNLTSREERPLLMLETEKTTLGRIRTDRLDDLVATIDVDDALLKLDITLLHDLVLERFLNISKSTQEAGTHVGYSRNFDDAVKAVRSDAQIAFATLPPLLSDVRAVAEAGLVMPQKSTFFYPKLASGLVIAPFDDPSNDADSGA